MAFSVGDFAEQIIAQDKLKSLGGNAPPTFESDPSIYSPDVNAQAPDISNVTVPNDFVNSIVENKEIAVEQPTAVKESLADKQEVPPVQSLGEVHELKSLVAELKELIAEVKQTLTEMTAVGSLGVNMAPAPKDNKEDEDDDITKLLKKLKGNKKKALN